jgi:hypothetical protein
VWACNELTGEEGFKPVVHLFRNSADRLVHLSYRRDPGSARRGASGLKGGDAEDGDDLSATITGTDEHPFWSLTRDAWVEMAALKLGERLLLADGAATVTGIRIERLEAPVTVYNFEVADWHTYHVGSQEGGWVFVHNLCKLYKQKDALGRPTAAVARIRPGDIGTGTRASNAARSSAQAAGNAGDDAGHIIARILGGPGGKRSGNVFAQNAGTNRGTYRDFEARIRNYIERNNVTAYARVRLRYSGNSMRPTGIDYRVRFSDGHVMHPPRFPN